MMSKHRSSILLSLLLCFSIGARADNIITISSTEGAPDDEVTVSIGLQNSDILSSLQVSIPLDENLTLVEGSGRVGSRCSNHSLTVGVKDGVLNVFVYSLSMAAISGNSGEVASFKLRLGNVPQTVSLTPSKLVLTNSSGTTIDGNSQNGSVTTRCAKAEYSTMEVDYGEVPIRGSYERTVTVTNVGNADLTITALTFSDVNVFSSTTTLPIVISAGQSQQLHITYAPVERGTISKTLKVECNSVSKLNTIALKAMPFAVNELHVQPASGVSDEEVTVRMTMNNMDAISGYQVEFTLPSQFDYVDNSFALSSRKQDHVGMATLNGNTLRIIVYSPSDKPFTGNDGEIGTFKVKLAGRYGTTLTPSKTVLSATINNKVENVVSEVYGGNITIQSPQISCNNTLNFGAVSVTEACEKTLTIRNYGSAPLTVSRIVFNNEAMSIKESLPIVIPTYGNANVTVVCSSIEQTAFEGTMNIYSNDPDMRMKEIAVSGSRFAPNYMTISCEQTKTTDEAVMELATDIYDNIMGVQFDIEYPSEYYEPYDGNVTVEGRAAGMTVNMRQIDENTVRYFCYSLSGSGIQAGSGKVMTIKLAPKGGSVPAGTYTVKMKNIVLGTADMTNKYASTDQQVNFNVIDVLLGDVNGDGKINALDVRLLINRRFNRAMPDGYIEEACDINGDGRINALDVRLVINLRFNR
ncbi:MAG: choice-of-anchor D domain-containing protein [Prevotella sp.]|nr:choice-of-anchor D domain-containing protein [Prevotella sp.]